MSCDTTWIIRHELVYFGPFSLGLFSGGHIFGECSKTEKALGLFLVSKILKKFGRFPKISPELIFGMPPVKHHELCRVRN